MGGSGAIHSLILLLPSDILLVFINDQTQLEIKEKFSPFFLLMQISLLDHMVQKCAV